MGTLQRCLGTYRQSFFFQHIRSFLPHEPNSCVVNLSHSPASNNISKRGTPVIVLVMKVMFEVPDDSLISTGLSDILSTQNKKTQTNKKKIKTKQTKKRKQRDPYASSVALEIRALI